MTNNPTQLAGDEPGRPSTSPVSVGLISDVAQVLDMHGITVRDLSEDVEVLAALHHIVDAVAAERGGRRQP